MDKPITNIVIAFFMVLSVESDAPVLTIVYLLTQVKARNRDGQQVFRGGAGFSIKTFSW